MNVSEIGSSNNLDVKFSHQLERILEPYYSKHHREKCYPGLLFQQGQRQMVQINVPASDFSGLLQAVHSTNNDPDSGKNRPEVKGHAEEIKDYIIERNQKNQPWILGTLTANVPLEKIKLINLGRGICLVVIPRGVKLDITDGQHRKRAIHELIESSNSNLISEDDFPITLVLENNFRQCQIDFRDMAQTKALDKSLLQSFGEYSGKIGIVKNLINEVHIFRGKTDKIKDKPNSKQKHIYAMNYINRFVGTVFANNPDAELKDYQVDLVSPPLIEALNLFFSQYTGTQYISHSNVEELTIGEITEFKEYSLLSTRVGLEVLGKLMYHVYDNEANSFNHNQILQLATQIDWSRENSLWMNNVVKINPSQKITIYPAGANEAVKAAKSDLGWM
jgi:DNA sulfur modification protein DndB